MAPSTPDRYRVRIVPKNEQVVYEDPTIALEFDIEKEGREWRVFVPPHRLGTIRQPCESEEEWQRALCRVAHYLKGASFLGLILPIRDRVRVVRRDAASAQSVPR